MPLRPWTWVTLIVVALIGHFLIAEPGMFPGWDESVFYSQSGDIVGVDSDPSYYAPSREPGTPLLIWGMREAGLSLESIRLGFMVVFLVGSGMGFFLLAPLLRWGAVAGFIAFTGHWISLAFSWRFFGVPVASALLVLSVGISVRLLTEPSQRRSWWWAMALAFSSAGMLSMRHLEGWIAAAVLWLVLVGFAIRSRRRLVRYVVVAGIVFLGAFLFIESLRAIHYHESVGAWFEALRAQLSGAAESTDSATTRFLKVVGSLGGGYHLWFQERIPTISIGMTGIAAVMTLLVVVWRALARRRHQQMPDSSSTAPPTVLWWLGAGLVLLYLAFFVIGGFPASPRDRYLMWFVAGGAFLIGAMLRGSFMAMQSALLGVAIAVWLLGSFSAARFDTTTFTESGEGVRQLGLTMHVLADGDECMAASRYGAPAIQLASGCRVRSLSDATQARAWLEEAPAGSVRFLAFPDSDQLEDIPGWTDVSVSGSSMDLWFRDDS